MFSDYEVSKEEMENIPRHTLHIPADIPTLDVRATNLQI